MGESAIIHLPGEGRAIPMGAFSMTVKADAGETGEGVVHGFRVGSVRSRKLNIYLPSAMVGYFDELASAAAAGEEFDDETLGQMADRYSMKVVGPVPDGYS